jgi:Protein DA1/LIM domain
MRRADSSSGVPETDEALARRLQYEEQMASRRARLERPLSMSSQEIRDFELARQLASLDLGLNEAQEHSLFAAVSTVSASHGPARARSNSFDTCSTRTIDDLLEDTNSADPESPQRSDTAKYGTSKKKKKSGGQPTPSAGILPKICIDGSSDSGWWAKSQLSGESTTTDQRDFALALHMQELESTGRGRENSVRRIDEATEGNPMSLLRGFHSGDSDDGDGSDEENFRKSTTIRNRPKAVSASLRMPLLSQEEKDAKLARFMLETGDSVRNLTKEEVEKLLDPCNGISRRSTAVRVSANKFRNSAGSIDLRVHDERFPTPQTILDPENRISGWSPDQQVHSNTFRRSAGNVDIRVQAAQLPAPLTDIPFVPSPLEAKPQTPPPASMHRRELSAGGGGLIKPIDLSVEPPPPHRGQIVGGKEKKKKMSFLGGLRKRSKEKFPHEEIVSSHSPPVSPCKQEAPLMASEEGRLLQPNSAGVSSAGPSPTPASLAGQRIPPSQPTSLGIPLSIPPAPGGSIFAPTRIVAPSSLATQARFNNHSTSLSNTGTMSNNAAFCATCHRTGGPFIMALERTYHPHCFLCDTCGQQIDHTVPFAFSVGADGKTKRPHHRECYSSSRHMACAKCRLQLQPGLNGKVSVIKHPFFHTEQICPTHLEYRLCAGCNRFEPDESPFADIPGEANLGRCVCGACGRTVVADNREMRPLWKHVLSFFERHLGLPVWPAMRDLPVLSVSLEALRTLFRSHGSPNYGSHQIMAGGLCVLPQHAEQQQTRIKLRLPALRYNAHTIRFDPLDMERRGYAEYKLLGRSSSSNAVTAVLCKSGLPRDLTAAILAHEATHAWIRCHPKYRVDMPLPAVVEKGCAQLVALLFLQSLPEPTSSSPTRNKANGPTDKELRHYFRYCIESDDTPTFGVGFKNAAEAHRAIGIEALLNHVVQYRNFPAT